MSDQRVLEVIKELRLNPDYVPNNGELVAVISASDLIVKDGVTKDLNTFHIPVEIGCLMYITNHNLMDNLKKG